MTFQEVISKTWQNTKATFYGQVTIILMSSGSQLSEMSILLQRFTGNK